MRNIIELLAFIIICMYKMCLLFGLIVISLYVAIVRGLYWLVGHKPQKEITNI